jgi:hypothetical protein
MSDARTFVRRREADDVGATMTVELAVGMAGRNQALELKAALLSVHPTRTQPLAARERAQSEIAHEIPGKGGRVAGVLRNERFHKCLCVVSTQFDESMVE